jgi:hypothetical protein
MSAVAAFDIADATMAPVPVFPVSDSEEPVSEGILVLMDYFGLEVPSLRGAEHTHLHLTKTPICIEGLPETMR